MSKIIFQGLVIIIIFLGSVFILSRIDWMSIFKVKDTSDKTEEKLGELFWKYFKNQDTEITDSITYCSVDSILLRLCEANDIPRKDIKLHLLRNSQVNAFALPDNHMVIYSGLIKNCDTPEELAGVIGHELAHINERHVMKKLIKEIGLSVLISITTGSAGGEITREIARTMSSSAYDRTLEKEADLMAVRYLNNAEINPEGLANFLYKISDSSLPSMLSWVSSHPESKERSAYILQHLTDTNIQYQDALPSDIWTAVKERVNRQEGY